MYLILQQAGPHMLCDSGTRAGASTPRYASTAKPLLVPHSLASHWVTADHVANSELQWDDTLALYDKRHGCKEVEEWATFANYLTYGGIGELNYPRVFT